jgi:hypothetical protein
MVHVCDLGLQRHSYGFTGEYRTVIMVERNWVTFVDPKCIQNHYVIINISRSLSLSLSTCL